MLRFLSKLARKLQTATTARAPRRAPRRPNLAVEALEERLALSATSLVQTAGSTALTAAVGTGTNSGGNGVIATGLNPSASFSLRQGNLFESLGGSQTLIDTNVQSFATCPFAYANYLFDLSASGQVREYSGSGTNWTALTGSNTHATTLVSLVPATSGTGDLYMLGSNNGALNQTVWHYSGAGTNWNAVTSSSTNATALVVAINGVFMLDSTDTVSRYNGQGTTWTAVTSHMNATTLVAADGGLFMLGSANGAVTGTVWQYLNSGTNWNAVSASNMNVTALVAADGGLYMVGITTGLIDGQVWQYAGSGTNWNDVNGNFSPTALVAADGGLFALDNFGNGVWQYNGSGYTWTEVTDSNARPTALVAADGGLFMLGTYNGSSTEFVSEYSGLSTGWSALTFQTNATTLVAADGRLFMLASVNGAPTETVWQYTGAGSFWTAVTGSNTNATALVAVNGGLFMLANNSPGNENVWQYAGSGNWTGQFSSNTNATALVAADGSVETLVQIGTATAVWEYNYPYGNWAGLTASNLNVTALVAAEGGLFMLASNYGAANGTVWQLTGAASNWTAVTASTMNATALVEAEGDHLYMLGSNTGAAAEQDWAYTGSGTNWNSVSAFGEQPITTGSNPAWSGYVVPGSNVVAVGGTWVQPAATGPNGAYSAIWVGIDGDGSSTVEQIGTDAHVSNGLTSYFAWIEFYGDSSGGNQGQYYYPAVLPLVISPGDTISAEVALVPGTSRSFEFWMTVTPPNGGTVETYHSIVTMSYVTPALATAEWIVENPGNAGQPLTNFGQVTFTGAWAHVGAQTGSITSLPSLALNMSSGEGSDVTTNPPIATSTPGYNEAGLGFTSSIFQVTWTAGAVSGGVGGGSGSGGLGGGPHQLPNSVLVTQVGALGQGPGTAPLSFLAASAPQAALSDQVFSTLGGPSHEDLLAPAGRSDLGSAAALDALFAHDALDNHLGSPSAVDALFALDAPGSLHRHELFW